MTDPSPSKELSLTDSEVSALLRVPAALQLVIDWHHTQEAEADAIGEPELRGCIQHSEDRRKALEYARDCLLMENGDKPGDMLIVNGYERSTPESNTPPVPTSNDEVSNERLVELLASCIFQSECGGHADGYIAFLCDVATVCMELQRRRAGREPGTVPFVYCAHVDGGELAFTKNPKTGAGPVFGPDWFPLYRHAQPPSAPRNTGVTDAAGLPLFEGDRVNVTWLAELGVTELDCEAAGTVEYMPDKITAAWFVKFDRPFCRHVGPEGIYESDSMMLIQTTGDEFTCSFEKLPATSSAKCAGRTDEDYAIEHGRYLADAVDAYIAAHSARNVSEVIGESTQAENDAVTDCWVAMRDRVYEFRKRADRAAATKSGDAP